VITALALAAAPAIALTTQTTKLMPEGAEGTELAGFAVDLDGDTAILGAPYEDSGGFASGAAYVYTDDGDGFSQTTKLTAPDEGKLHLFGGDVDVDGDTLVVGASGDGHAGLLAGSVYVFERADDSWTNTAKLTAPAAEAGDYYGATVALEGDQLLVAASGDDDAATWAGAVHVYENSADGWVHADKLTAPDADPYDAFGSNLALDGDTAIVSALGDDDAADEGGSAYVFAHASSWTDQAKLTASDAEARDWFGHGVGIDDDVAVIGAPRHDSSGDFSGAAYVFERSDGQWTETAEVTGLDTDDGDGFGNAVAVSGQRALVGAVDADNGPVPGVDQVPITGDDAATDGAGSAHLVSPGLDGEWGHEAKLTSDDGEDDDEFGDAVAIEDEQPLVGAPHDDGQADEAGAAYVYQVCPPNVPTTEQVPQRVCTATNAASDASLGFP